MPASAYLQSALFLILAAAALFASAGTASIVGFWLYLSIFAAIILASLLALDPSLLRERPFATEKDKKLQEIPTDGMLAAHQSSRPA